jgi:sugar lactone lactonase YvrE
MHEVTAQVLVDAGAELGEGPVWDQRGERLLWVDILRGSLFATQADGSTTRLCLVDEAVPFVALREGAGFLLGIGGRVAWCDDDARIEDEVVLEEEPTGNRLNDAGVDPRGRLWVGSMASAGDRPAGSLYRVDPDRTVHRQLGGIAISNGIDWSPDGSVMYYVDTPTNRIDRFTYDLSTGAIGARTVFVDLSGAPGVPDGLTVDANGNVLVALWGAAQVRAYSPEGEELYRVRTPAPQPTSCAFGGPDLGTLFITSARAGMDANERAQSQTSGAVFVTEGLGPGQGPHRFRG